MLKLPIHDLNCLFGTIHDGFEDLPSLSDRDLCLVHLLWCQALEGSIEIVLYFGLELWHNVLLLFSNELNELMTLLPLEMTLLDSLVHL